METTRSDVNSFLFITFTIWYGLPNRGERRFLPEMCIRKELVVMIVSTYT